MVRVETRRVLRMIKDLGQNWNDANAPRIPRDVIYTCYYLLDDVEEIPKLSPSNRKSIYLTIYGEECQ